MTNNRQQDLSDIKTTHLCPGFMRRLMYVKIENATAVGTTILLSGAMLYSIVKIIITNKCLLVNTCGATSLSGREVGASWQEFLRCEREKHLTMR